MSENFKNINLDKEDKQTVKLTDKDVGPINSDEDLETLLVEDQFLKNINDPYKNLHIKTSMKEDEDFVILHDKAWDYLYEIYGGVDMPRFSIEADKEEESDES